MDVAGFEAAMAEQKAKARAAWAGSGEAADEAIWFDLAEKHGPTEFLGYDTETAEGQVLALLVGGKPVETRGDRRRGAGRAEPDALLRRVGRPGRRHRHAPHRQGAGSRSPTCAGRPASSSITAGSRRASSCAAPPPSSRSTTTGGRAIRANHSATHLLHEALRRALGDHVAQRGSLVAPDRLRFDFAHPKAMTPAELAGVEAEVNAYVRQNTPVETRIMTPDAAEALGARALFGEKYGDEVRVVAMGARPGSGLGAGGDTYSLELCGGTHVARTGDIGTFRLVSEGASAGGVRRIEALTGAGALAQLARRRGGAGRGRRRCCAPAPRSSPSGVRALLDERKAQADEIAELRRRLALAGGPAEAQGPETVAGIPFLAQALKGVSGKDLRGLIDEHKARLGSGVILLVADTGDKAAVAAGVTDDLTARISAVDLVRVAAEALGGKGGGGRPDMAQAGGADPARAPEAIAAARALLEA